MRAIPQRSWPLALSAMLVSCFVLTDRAAATCTGTGGEIASATVASPLTANLGSYTPPGVGPASVVVPLTLNLTYTVPGTGNCQFYLGFQRSSLPATLNRVGGGTTPVPYSLLRPSGASIVFSGAPSASNTAFRFTANNKPATRTINLEFQMLPNAPTNTLGGSYFDDLTLVVMNRNGAVVGSSLITAPYSANGLVNTSCSITAPSNISQSIQVNSTGLTTGMTGAAPQFDVACNSSSNVTLSSQNGAVTRGNLAEGALANVSGFRSKIEYTATINGGAGNVTLNTGNSNSASGTFNAAAVTTSGTQVTIAPEASSVPLLAGSYSDVLTVTITPQ